MKLNLYSVPTVPTEFASDVNRVLQGVSPRDLEDMKKPFRPSESARAPLDFQQEVIQLIREHPISSYVLCGPSGMGKTFIVESSDPHRRHSVSAGITL